MQVDFSRAITDLEGAEIEDGGKTVTLSRIACNALLAMRQDDKNLTGEEKAKRYGLAVKLVDAADCEVSAEDIALIKRLIGEVYPPIFVGRAWELLEGS